MVSSNTASVERGANAGKLGGAPGPSWLSGVLAGALCAGVLTLPKLAFSESIGGPAPFLLYFFAIMLAGYQGGMLAGLLTTALSAGLAAAFFIPTPFEQYWPNVYFMLGVFAVEGTAISVVTARFVGERRRALAVMTKLRSTRDKLNLVLRGTDEGITVQDGRGKLVYANRLAAELTGFESARELLSTPPAEVLGRFEMFDADGRPFPAERLPGRVVLAGGESDKVLLRFRRRGSPEDRWVVLRSNAVRNKQGAVRVVVNLFRDVTVEHQQQEALGLAREWFQIALSSIGDAVITTDAEGRINLINPVAEQLTGWSSADAVQRPLSEVFHIISEATRESVPSPVERVLREGVVVGLANHTLLVRRDASELAIDDSAAPIVDAHGKLQGVILVFRDVTEKRAHERRQAFLSSATQQFNSSLDYRATLATVANLAVPVIADWCAIDILEEGKLERLAVAHVDPAKIEWVREVQRRYPSDPEAPRGVHHILRTGQAEMLSEIPWELFERMARDDEHLEVLRQLGLRSYIGVPLTRDGNPFGVITLAMAESERRYSADDLEFAKSLADRASIAVENARLFRQVAQARSEAVQANRAKDEFLAMLGHELRNPLAPMQTALELIRLRTPGAQQPEHQVLERQVKHLVRLVDDLLDVARIARNKIELEREPLEIAAVVERALEMVWPEGGRRVHSIHRDVEPGLVVSGDAVRLAQVIANLLSNAAKYTEPGGNIWIEAKRQGESALVSVRDDGMGIGSETLKRVFEMFVQEPQALDRARGGLGLGLAIVHSLVLAHGGTVSAHSDGIGKGAKFVVKLPLSGNHQSSSRRPQVNQTTSQAERILIVDDNPDARELLAQLLSRLGHVTFTASTGARALEIAARERLTIALLDIGLPEMDGYELAGRLRTLDGQSELRLLATTGYGQPVERARSRAAGFELHLVKPVTLETLKEVIGTAARRPEASNDGFAGS